MTDGATGHSVEAQPTVFAGPTSIAAIISCNEGRKSLDQMPTVNAVPTYNAAIGTCRWGSREWSSANRSQKEGTGEGAEGGSRVVEDMQEKLFLRQSIENRAALRARACDLESMGQAKYSKMNDLLDEARLELEAEAEGARLCPEGKRKRKEEEEEEEEEGEEEEHAHQLPTQNLREDNEKQRKGPSFTWKECVEAATRSRMAMPLGGGRRKGGKLSKHDFIYDARLELGEEADWARFCPTGKGARKEKEEEKAEGDRSRMAMQPSAEAGARDRKSTRLNSSHRSLSRMPSSA